MVTNKRLIGLSGPKGAGKDTVYKMIEAMVPFKTKRFACADHLKLELTEEFDLNFQFLNGPEKDTEYTKFYWSNPMFEHYKPANKSFDDQLLYREMLQIYGTEIVRKARGSDYWVEKVMDEVYEYLDEDEDNVAVITDIRFPNEVSITRGNGGSIIRVDGEVSGENNEHASESTPLEFDYMIPGRGKAQESETKGRLKDVLWSAIGVNVR